MHHKSPSTSPTTSTPDGARKPHTPPHRWQSTNAREMTPGEWKAFKRHMFL